MPIEISTKVQHDFNTIPVCLSELKFSWRGKVGLFHKSVKIRLSTSSVRVVWFINIRSLIVNYMFQIHLLHCFVSPPLIMTSSLSLHHFNICTNLKCKLTYWGQVWASPTLVPNALFMSSTMRKQLQEKWKLNHTMVKQTAYVYYSTFIFVSCRRPCHSEINYMICAIIHTKVSVDWTHAGQVVPLVHHNYFNRAVMWSILVKILWLYYMN